MIAAPKKPTFLARLQKYEQLKQAQIVQSAQPSPARPSYPLELLKAPKREIVILSQQPIVADDFISLEDRKRECREQLDDLEMEEEPLKHEEQQLLEQLAAVREAREEVVVRKGKVIEAMRELNREESALLDGMLSSVSSGRKRRLSEDEEPVREAHVAAQKPAPTVAEEDDSNRRQADEENPGQETHPALENAADENVPQAGPSAEAERPANRCSSGGLTVPARKKRAPKTLTFDEMETFTANRTNSRGNGPIECQVCGVESDRYAMPWKFRAHLATHLRKEHRPFKCPIDGCSQKSVQITHVKSHLRCVHHTEWSNELEERSTDPEMKPRWDAMLQH